MTLKTVPNNGLDMEDIFGTEFEAKPAPNAPYGMAAAFAAKEEKTVPKIDPNQGETRWQSNGDFFWASHKTINELPPGLYRATELHNIGHCLERLRIDVDDLIDVPNSPSSQVIAEIREFWFLEPEFAKRGFIHKRGILLGGPPGSGKTSTLQQLISIVVNEHGGIAVFLAHPSTASIVLQLIRRIEPKRPIIGLLEDFDALVDRYGSSEYLAMLDGETQISNIVFVGTSNYPEKLDPRFIDRPSRFDLLQEIGMPTSSARKLFFQTKEPSLTTEELEEWVKRSKGFSFAHLREMIVLCRCYGKTLDEAVKRMEKMRRRSMKSRDLDNAGDELGFHKRRSEDNE